MADRLEKLIEIDGHLVRTARRVRVLSAISFPPDTAQHLIDDYHAGRRRLPEVQRAGPIDPDIKEALDRIQARLDLKDPAAAYLHKTARSYRQLADLIDASTTPEYHAISRRIYGGPNGRLAGAELTHLQAAEHLMESSDAMHVKEASDPCTIPSEAAAEWLRARVGDFFDPPLKIVVDDHLNAKASASSKRVRLRGNTLFSEEHLKQLAEHEVFVHSLTGRNGRAQQLTSLGLGAARTTATQEGLATFAELVTGSIDLNRLWRIALRIRAIAWAEEGADFVQLVDRLVEAGEEPEEAIQTAMRIFRGGDPRGRYVFTKDTVYLKGLFAVHTFLRKAIANRQPELIARLFVGRISLADATDLEPAFADDTIAPAQHMPQWANRVGSLAGFLAVSALIDNVALHEVTLDDIEDVVTRDHH